MGEKLFTVARDPDGSRHLRILRGADVPAAQPAAEDDELRATLVSLVDCLIRRFGAATDRSELPDRLWTAGQLAEWLQIPETTVLEYARDGKIPSVRLGKHVRFDPRAVMQALA